MLKRRKLSVLSKATLESSALIGLVPVTHCFLHYSLLCQDSGELRQSSTVTVLDVELSATAFAT